MKAKIAMFVLATLLLVNIIAFASAQEEVTTSATVPESEITIPSTETTTVTPDKPLVWGLNRALERIKMAITLGKAAKAEKGLQNAESRLLAINQMIQEKKMDKAEKAIKAYKQDVEKVKAAVQAIKNDKDPEAELKEKIKLQKKLEMLENMEDRLETTVQVKVYGNLSEQEQEKVNAMVALLENSTANALVWMQDSVTGAKIRIKAKASLSDENVNKIVDKIETETGLKELREKKLNASVARLERRITVLNSQIEKIEEKGKNATLRKAKAEIAEDLVTKLKEIQASGTANWATIKEAVKEAKVETREAYIEKASTRTVHAADVISNVIDKLEARQAETGKDVSNAIAKLTTVEAKLRTRAEKLQSISTSTESGNAGGETPSTITGTEAGNVPAEPTIINAEANSSLTTATAA